MCNPNSKASWIPRSSSSPRAFESGISGGIPADFVVAGDTAPLAFVNAMRVGTAVSLHDGTGNDAAAAVIAAPAALFDRDLRAFGRR